MSENLEFIRQEYESWLAEKAIASKSLTVRFLKHEASTDSLSAPVLTLSQTKQTI